MKQKNKLFCIVGRTGSGKSYLANEVARELGLRVLASYTTRPPRENEKSSNPDHIFITKEQFDDIPKEAMVAFTEIKGNYYCCTINQILTNDIYVIDPKGIEYLQQKNLPDVELVVIYINCGDVNTRKERFLQRDNTTEEGFYQRDEAENEQFTDFELNGNPNYDVDNSFDTDDAFLRLRAIIQFEKYLEKGYFYNEVE